MVDRGKTWAEYTNFPDVYRDTYWGRFRDRYDDDDHNPDCQIIANRNLFAERHDLVQSVFRMALYKLEIAMDCASFADHTESYSNRSGRFVLVTSPYGRGRCVTPLQAALGFRKTRKLYVPDAETFCATFDTMNHVKMATRVLEMKR
jgi:hypothetical protein